VAQANRVKARSQEKAAEADLRRAQETAGDRGQDNAQLLSARAAIEKAELDLQRTQVVAPSRGRVTDLRTDVGQFAQAGTPAMTLITIHDLWIDAEMTENNLGNVKPGDKVAIVLDAMPGEVLKGRIRSVGGGISAGQQTQPGSLPTIENSRDWLRQAQRFPGGGRVRTLGSGAAARRARRRPGRRADLHGRAPRDERARRCLHQGDELLLVPVLIAGHASR
jgi:multidrug resistance efflux pump